MDNQKTLNGMKRDLIKKIIANSNALMSINLNNYFADIDLFHKLVVSIADATNELIIINNSITKES